MRSLWMLSSGLPSLCHPLETKAFITRVWHEYYDGNPVSGIVGVLGPNCEETWIRDFLVLTLFADMPVFPKRTQTQKPTGVGDTGRSI